MRYRKNEIWSRILQPSVTTSRPRKHVELYREMLDEISVADDMGFDSAWLTEHHFLADGYCPSLMVTAGAIAARTKNIRIGTGVLLIPLHDPVRVAEDSAVVDLISEGRLILGLGLGYRKEEFDGFGRALKERKGRIEESLDILTNSWQEGSFSHNGKYYKLKNMDLPQNLCSSQSQSGSEHLQSRQ